MLQSTQTRFKHVCNMFPATAASRDFCRNAADEVHLGAPQFWQFQITCNVHQAQGITQDLISHAPKSGKST